MPTKAAMTKAAAKAPAVKAPAKPRAKKAPAGMNYDQVLAALNAGFQAKLELFGPAMFLVETPLLFAEYVAALPTKEDQIESNCRACADFMERYGRLVFIDTNGNVIPAYWDQSLIHGKYEASIARLQKAVAQGTPNTVFYTDQETLGRPTDGEWTHHHIKHGCKHSLTNGAIFTPEQNMAIRQEDFLNLRRSLADFNITLVRQVLKLIKSEALPHRETIAEQTEWFYNIYVDIARDDVRKSQRTNVIWRHVAVAPAGWCAVRGKLLGFLLKTLKEGVETEEAIKLFAAKAHGGVHMRPTSEASEGNIDQAEKLIERLGLAPSLARRYATLNDVKLHWVPTKPKGEAPKEGVFGAIRKTKKAPDPFNSQDTPPVKMTLDKFRKKILPDVLTMQLLIPSGPQSAFVAFTEAVNKDAPPLLQWDNEDNRNTTSLYLYTEGSLATQWGLTRNTWVDVHAMVLSPYLRDDEEAFQKMDRGMLFVLDGARDTHNEHSCLFPAIIRGELHSVRKTIEEFSGKSTLAEAPEDEVLCQGLLLRSSNKNAPIIARVKTNLGVSAYHLYCWD